MSDVGCGDEFYKIYMRVVSSKKSVDRFRSEAPSLIVRPNKSREVYPLSVIPKNPQP